MATKAELDASAADLIDVGVPERERWRGLYGVPKFIRWMDEDLDLLESDSGDSEPNEQLYALFDFYVRGDALEVPRHLHVMIPAQKGIWELRTPALRVFGWFALKDCFVCSSGGLKHQIRKQGLYERHLQLAIERRRELALSRPDYVSGVTHDDVLSDAP